MYYNEWEFPELNAWSRAVQEQEARSYAEAQQSLLDQLRRQQQRLPQQQWQHQPQQLQQFPSHHPPPPRWPQPQAQSVLTEVALFSGLQGATTSRDNITQEKRNLTATQDEDDLPMNSKRFKGE